MDDDEVVFEDSALYHHLRDVGFQEDDIVPEKKINLVSEATLDNNIVQQGNSASCSESGVPRESCPHRFRDYVSDYIFDDSWVEEVRTMCKSHACRMVDTCLKSARCLNEDDAVYIESFVKSLRFNEMTEEQDTIMNQMLTQIGVLGVTIAYGFFRMFYMKPSTLDFMTCLVVYSLDVLSVFMTIVALAPATAKFAIAGRLVGRLEARSAAIDKLLVDVTQLQRLARKTILFIRETEVIHRGFTFVTASVLRFEMRTAIQDRQCADLRRALFHRSRRVMLCFREATITLLVQYPQPSRTELSQLVYMASQPLEDYGQCILLQDDQIAELTVETDGYSLASLKDMVNLMNAQISEFFRVLCILSLLQSDQSRAFFISGFPNHQTMIARIASCVCDQCTPLEQSFVLHKSLISKMATIDIKRTERISKLCSSSHSSVSKAYTAVHSLLLHLQAAITRLQPSDDQLEQFAATATSNASTSDKPGEPQQETQDPTCQSVRQENMAISQHYATLSATLDIVGRELVACRDCWEEASSRLQILTKKTTDAAQLQGYENETSDIAINASSINNDVRTSLIPDCDPVVEDQVFEGVTNADPDDRSTDATIDADDERRRSKKEAVRVLTELRSVIAVRAKETAERERAAILRQRSINDSSVEDQNIIVDYTSSLTKNSAISTASTIGLPVISAIDESFDEDDIGRRSSGDRTSCYRNNVCDMSIVDSLCRTWRAKDTPESLRDNNRDDNEVLNNHISSCSDCNSVGDHKEVDRITCNDGEIPLEREMGGGAFTSMLARLAVEKSHQMTRLSNVETFGDDSDDDEDHFNEDDDGHVADK